jgi:hypothetical protein
MLDPVLMLKERAPRFSTILSICASQVIPSSFFCRSSAHFNCPRPDTSSRKSESIDEDTRKEPGDDKRTDSHRSHHFSSVHCKSREQWEKAKRPQVQLLEYRYMPVETANLMVVFLEGRDDLGSFRPSGRAFVLTSYNSSPNVI